MFIYKGLSANKRPQFYCHHCDPIHSILLSYLQEYLPLALCISFIHSQTKLNLVVYNYSLSDYFLFLGKL